MVEITSEEQNKIKRMKRMEDSFRDLSDNIKCTNIRIIGVPEGEERISELEDKMVEISSEEQNKVKSMKRTEDSPTDLWDNIKHTNLQIIRVPEDEEEKKGYEKIFEEIS